jgi:hypothetical protein
MRGGGAANERPLLVVTVFVAGSAFDVPFAACGWLELADCYYAKGGIGQGREGHLAVTFPTLCETDDRDFAS